MAKLTVKIPKSVNGINKSLFKTYFLMAFFSCIFLYLVASARYNHNNFYLFMQKNHPGVPRQFKTSSLARCGAFVHHRHPSRFLREEGGPRHPSLGAQASVRQRHAELVSASLSALNAYQNIYAASFFTDT